jgi:hypothetical protein
MQTAGKCKASALQNDRPSVLQLPCTCNPPALASAMRLRLTIFTINAISFQYLVLTRSAFISCPTGFFYNYLTIVGTAFEQKKNKINLDCPRFSSTVRLLGVGLATLDSLNRQTADSLSGKVERSP